MEAVHKLLKYYYQIIILIIITHRRLIISILHSITIRQQYYANAYMVNNL